MDQKLSFDDFLEMDTPVQMHVIDGLPANQILKLMIYMDRKIRACGDDWHPLDITYAYCRLAYCNELMKS